MKNKFLIVLFIVGLALLVSAGTKTITLNAPANNSNVSNLDILFNTTVSTTGSYLINISLWHNLTGTWGRNETTTKDLLENVSYDHGLAADTTGGSQAQCFGIGINMTNGTRIISSVTKHTGDNSQELYILDINKVPIATASFSGDIAIINQTLQADENYYICGNATTGSVTHDYKSGLPVTGTYFRWACGLTDTGCDGNTYTVAEVNLTEDLSVTSSEETWSKNVTSSGLWGIEVCDDAGTCSFSTNYTLNIVFTENSQTFNSNATEGTSEVFQANVTLSDILRISTVKFVYNNTPEDATYTEYAGNNYILEHTQSIPTVDIDSNKTFFWNVTFEDGSEQQTLSNNQTILNFSLDDCSTGKVPLFNFTLADEKNTQVLSGAGNVTSIKVDLTFANPLNRTSNFTFSKLYTTTNPAKVCAVKNLSGTEFRVDGIVEYTSLQRFTEFYNIQNLSLTNATDDQNITLYNLNDTEGQAFKITYKDANLIIVQSAIVQIQRKYVDEGVFRTVEIPKTGTEGHAIGHLVVDDAVYNIIILKEGVTLATFTDVVADCQNPSLQTCSINLNEFGSTSLPADFTHWKDISFTLTWNNNTREISSVFSIISGASATVDLNVTLHDSLGNTSVCDDSLVASGGTLTCTVPAAFGNSTVIARLFKDGVEVGKRTVRLGVDSREIYGASIMFIALLVFLVIAGVGASSDNPMAFGIILIVASILMVALNIVVSPSWYGTGATVLWFVVAIVLILIKGGSRD